MYRTCDYKVVNDKYGNKIFILFFINIFSRKIVRFNLTTNPTKQWQENQLRQLNDGTKKLHLITDNDIVFNHVNFDMFDINRIRTKPYTPKMNAHIERYIGSFKREALNYYHNSEYTKKSLYNIAKEYVYFYNNYQTSSRDRQYYYT